MDHDEYLDNTGDTEETKQFLAQEAFDAVPGLTLTDPAMDLVVGSTYVPIFQEIVDSTGTDPADLLTASVHQDVEVLVSSTSEDIVDSTRTDRVDHPIASAQQDVEEIPVSNTFKFIPRVQLTLLFY
ncbi:hypothetical protein C8R45DRAFT_856659, partial [Mycena sanguinolenta]